MMKKTSDYIVDLKPYEEFMEHPGVYDVYSGEDVPDFEKEEPELDTAYTKTKCTMIFNWADVGFDNVMDFPWPLQEFTEEVYNRNKEDRLVFKYDEQLYAVDRITRLENFLDMTTTYLYISMTKMANE